MSKMNTSQKPIKYWIEMFHKLYYLNDNSDNLTSEMQCKYLILIFNNLETSNLAGL